MAVIHFHLTKDLAAFLLDQRLQEAAEKYLKLVRDLNLPLLKMFAHLPEEALFELAKQGLEKFLKGIVDDTAWENASASIVQYKADQIPGIAREKVEISDIVLVYSAQKQLLVKFLPEYTQDIRLITGIVLELENFFLGLGKYALQEHAEVQQQVLKTAYQKLQASEEELQVVNEELQATNDELQTTNEELQDQINRREAVELSLKELNEELEERIQARTAELDYQRAWFFQLFMQMPALIGILKGKEGVVELCNSKLLTLWGHRPVLGKTMRQAWPELEGQVFFNIVEKVFTTDQPAFRNEYPVMIDRNNDGNLKQAYINFIYAPFHNPKGETEGVIIYGVDVTEQLLARRKVEESRESLRLALEAGRMGTWHLDIEKGTISRTLHHDLILGYKEKLPNYTHRTFLDHVVPEDRHIVEAATKKVDASGKFSYEARIKRKDQQIRWIAVKGQYFYGEDKKPRRIAGVTQDITEQREAEEAIMQSNQTLIKQSEELIRINRDLDNFVYIASHDLKSPIANLEGLIYHLKIELRDKINEEEQGILAMMEASAARFRNTLDYLSQITRLSNKETKNQQLVPFKEIVEEVKADLQDLIHNAEVTFTENYEAETILFERKNLKSILYNLLTNAMKYKSRSRPCKIDIHTAKHDSLISLFVRDNGIGIPNNQQTKIYDMFKRFSTQAEGSGMGLNIVKRIMDANDGTIEVESKAENILSLNYILSRITGMGPRRRFLAPPKAF